MRARLLLENDLESEAMPNPTLPGSRLKNSPPAKQTAASQKTHTTTPTAGAMGDGERESARSTSKHANDLSSCPTATAPAMHDEPSKIFFPQFSPDHRHINHRPSTLPNPHHFPRHIFGYELTMFQRVEISRFPLHLVSTPTEGVAMGGGASTNKGMLILLLHFEIIYQYIFLKELLRYKKTEHNMNYHTTTLPALPAATRHPPMKPDDGKTDL